MPHTPGPWAIEAEKHNKDIFVTADGDGWRRLECIVSKDDCCTETALANAKLITAAPDLLEALKSARAAMQNQHHDKPRIGMEHECAIADSAIKKATEQWQSSSTESSTSPSRTHSC